MYQNLIFSLYNVLGFTGPDTLHALFQIKGTIDISLLFLISVFKTAKKVEVHVAHLYFHWQ